jgi:hypothetical protein
MTHEDRADAVVEKVRSSSRARRGDIGYPAAPIHREVR